MMPILVPAQIENDCKFYWLLIIVILFMAIFLMLIQRQKKKVIQRKNLELEKQIHEKNKELKLLQREIELRNRKLSARALYLSGRNQLINDLILFIETIPELSKVPTLDIQIKHLKDYLRDDTEWETFISHFEEVNPGFLARLRKLHPALTSNDMRYIAYIYMNLTTKEISNLLNITIYASKKRKERIISKMNLPNDTTLYSYLSDI
jgi:DNA-binding CsgD family transcriptional regulator